MKFLDLTLIKKDINLLKIVLNNKGIWKVTYSDYENVEAIITMLPNRVAVEEFYG